MADPFFKKNLYLLPRGLSKPPKGSKEGQFERLHLDNKVILTSLFEKNGGRIKYKRVMVVFIDFEWYRFGGRNVLLSIQIAVVSPDGSWNVIFYTRVGRRLRKKLSAIGHIDSSADAISERVSLEELVELAMFINDRGNLIDRKEGKTRVLLVIHNSVAEWSMLRDRDDADIVKKLTSIRKSPVTGVHPIKLNNRRIGKVDLEIFDTRLLAPAGLQSLDKLSDLLGKDEKKIVISEAYKRNMDQLLSEKPEEFEKYALRDTEVTAKLFFLLQRLLNELAFSNEE
jgi:hypothetical protein